MPARRPDAANRALRRLPERIVKPVPDTDDGPGNAWPAGPRTIACLWCDRAFSSSGRQERMCHVCRRHSN